ncbi:DNA helicase Pif1-like [Parasponia andersonii]|uniref:ATP-dependent DNA helicase n=1 Tax=Parasponia andersonii TaxID=3476 RepID=A0A2P5AHV0_PARAD|nr:DNA helicase Pif1-like [Parasponia andersonii]
MPTGILIDDLNNKIFREELDYDIKNIKEENFILEKNLNNEQCYIYEQIIESLNNKRQNSFFIYGHRGISKTYSWNTIITKIKSNNKIVLAVALFGIALLLLPKGKTAHLRFRIPLSIDKFSTCHIKKRTQLAKLIEKILLRLWDKVSMNNKNCFEALDKILRDLRNNFG